MKKNKIIKYFGIVLLFFSVLLFGSSFFLVSPEVAEVSNADDPVVYWFYAGVKIDDQTNSYVVSGTPGGIQYGHTVDFEKDLWATLSKKKLAVGPFLSKNEAINASRLYRSSKDKINQLPKDEVPGNVHWFAIQFSQSDRLRIFVFERAPGSVRTGSEKQFIDAFYVQIISRMFAIGPFYDYNQAELAKNLYRRNE